MGRKGKGRKKGKNGKQQMPLILERRKRLVGVKDDKSCEQRGI